MGTQSRIPVKGADGQPYNAGTDYDGTNHRQQVAPIVAGDSAATLTPGRKVVASAGTAVPLVGVATPCKWVTVTALNTNTQQINVGGAGVTAASGSSTGIPLQPGGSVTIPVLDVAQIYVDARVNSEGVSFLVGA